MITEKELKAMCTPEIIKKMVELAEGFEIKDDSDVICFYDYKCSIKTITESVILFPLLIHRAVGGWNKDNNRIYIYNDRVALIGKNEYKFESYQSENLTQCECALLHCLINILKEEV